LAQRQRESARELAQRQDAAVRELTELQHRLDLETRARERELAAKEHLDCYRELLLAAADDLLDRIRNIEAGRTYQT
jgi:hypothetical protein